MAVSIVILAFMEEENLRVLLPQINSYSQKFNEEYEIVVIDAATPGDKTKEVCIENGARYVNQRYPGFGGAFRTGIEEARNDKFLIMDADGSHKPEYIPDLYNLFLTGPDIVIGSRYMKGGRTDDSKSSVLMSKLLNFCYRLALGLKVSDLSTDFRMYHTADLKAVGPMLKCRNYDILEEVLLRIKLLKKPNKLVVKETPIYFDKRLFGESKRQLFKFICSYISTLFMIIGIRIKNSFKG